MTRAKTTKSHETGVVILIGLGARRVGFVSVQYATTAACIQRIRLPVPWAELAERCKYLHARVLILKRIGAVASQH
ncbi:MAG: hypothetical protein ACREUZ_16835, partial [Burkholderiales bacterium]